MQIRTLRRDEREPWLEMRRLLWPEASREELESELDEILDASEESAVLVAARDDGVLAGFVEVALREWAEGCTTSPVGYIEAWYVRPEHRRAGVGRALIDAAERWAAARGCTEMGSDTELANSVSQAAHRALGYGECLRLVCFKKRLA